MSPRAMFSRREREEAASLCDVLASAGTIVSATAVIEACAALGLDPYGRPAALAFLAFATTDLLVNERLASFDVDGEQLAQAAGMLRDGWLPGERPATRAEQRFDLTDVAEDGDAPILPSGMTEAEAAEAHESDAEPDVDEAIADDAETAEAEDAEVTACPRGVDPDTGEAAEDPDEEEEEDAPFDDEPPTLFRSDSQDDDEDEESFS